MLLAAALAFTIFYNQAFWQLLLAGRDPSAPDNLLLASGLLTAVTALQFAGLALLLPGPLVRPGLALLFLCTAIASFYMDRYAVFLNKEMLRNVLATDVAEARELLTADLLPHLLAFGVLPGILLYRVRLVRRRPGHACIVRLCAVAAAILVATAALLTEPRQVASLVRNHREARFLVTPTNYLVALYRLGRLAVQDSPGPRRPLALDARRLPALVPAGLGQRKPTLLVLVVGESLRSANFGLAGYARNTTPELAQLDVQVFPRVAACGTSTEVSVPCLFAPVGQRDYDEDRIRGQESLLHVLARTGFKVQWIDNQSGCKGVCAGLPQSVAGGHGSPECDGRRCLDEVLVEALASAVRREPGDLVVVLHMLGNHGPAYASRYPDAFRRFRPDCRSPQLDDCSPVEIVNAYDNAVLYTDHVLGRLVQYLRSLPARDTGLVYVSDHGESLGEHGFYLHGLPRAIAPREQLEVPMLFWLSPGLRQDAGVDLRCLASRTRQPASHDQFFHSVLGLLRIDTVVHVPALDVFSPCAGGPDTVA